MVIIKVFVLEIPVLQWPTVHKKHYFLTCRFYYDWLIIQYRKPSRRIFSNHACMVNYNAIHLILRLKDKITIFISRKIIKAAATIIYYMMLSYYFKYQNYLKRLKRQVYIMKSILQGQFLKIDKKYFNGFFRPWFRNKYAKIP